ncbi:MAG: hypothetical protein GY804_03890 [Alphaproteobacteria bacterium]|nr:hypothetical protein [Alphaproteobacteria bacterium]
MGTLIEVEETEIKFALLCIMEYLECNQEKFETYYQDGICELRYSLIKSNICNVAEHVWRTKTDGVSLQGRCDSYDYDFIPCFIDICLENDFIDQELKFDLSNLAECIKLVNKAKL